MHIDFLLKTFEENKAKDAIVWNNKLYNYGWLLDNIASWKKRIDKEKVSPGTVSIVEADYSPNSIGLFLALIGNGDIVVPITASSAPKKKEFIETAQGEISFSIDKEDNTSVSRIGSRADHAIYKTLRSENHPGLICFTSGSTGKSKAVVHDMARVLAKYKKKRLALRTIIFLAYDHFGGVNTMLHVLSNAGCIITLEDYSPDSVLRTVEKYKVGLLPTSPTFINMILFSKAYERHKLSSLKIVSYGTEPMPESTLRHFHELFPNIQLLQTYGLSEIGVMRSKSKSSDSLWVKVGGEGYETRVVNGILQIKAESAMLGYLNAPSPFTKDGWLDTGDRVEVDGDYIKILGRQSEMINVGGQKVFPQEVENVIRDMENVEDVTVYGEDNPVMGKIVCARIRLKKIEDRSGFTIKLKKHCAKRLEKFKIPVRITITENSLHSERFKKIRILKQKKGPI